ncbi:MAG: FxsA family protein, partial [Pseudolabrys sp.]
LRADRSGVALLLAGILLLIPGFISDLLALFLLVGSARRAAYGARTAHNDGVVDLAPEQWHLIGAETNGSLERHIIPKSPPLIRSV